MKDRPGKEREEGLNPGIQGVYTCRHYQNHVLSTPGRWRYLDAKRRVGDISVAGLESRNGLEWSGETRFSSQASG